MLKHYTSIFDYVEQQITAFDQPIPIMEGWEWSLKEHLKTSVFYLFGRLLTGNADDKPIKNIVRRIVRFRYAAEDIDVKDVDIYVDDPDRYHLSFLVKKYHDDVFVKESKMDHLLDCIKKEKINFGGCLVQNDNGKPKKIPLAQLAFCDQSNLMASPFAVKLNMTTEELLAMKEKGWGLPENGATISVDEVITSSEYEKQKNENTTENIKTPGKYAEVYQVWGMLPAEFAGGEEGKYTLQLHYITFLKGENNKNLGASLFSKEDKKKDRFKFIKQDDGDGLDNRAVGFGGVEELFEAQVWTNYGMIRKKDFLDAASKVFLKTNDSTLAARHPNGLKDLDNLELLEVEDGKDLTQVDTFPRNYQLFANAVQEWEQYAQNVSFATDALLGEAPQSGTPFRLQERLVVQGKAPHEESVKEFARFIEEIYTDWVIPYIQKELVKGVKFITELSRDEMEMVTNALVKREANKFIKEKILKGEIITEEEVEGFKQKVRDTFVNAGNKKFIEILKDELKDAPLKLKVSVSGNKDLAGMTDKLVNIFRQITANPQGFQQMMQDPTVAKMFNQILQYSGISPVYNPQKPATPTMLPAPQGAPVQEPSPLSVPEMAGLLK